MMKKKIILIGIIFQFIALLIACPLFAQSKDSPSWRNIRPADSPCWKTPDFGATEEQIKSLEMLLRSYISEIRRIRNQYMNEYFELRLFLSNLNVDTKTVVDKQNRLSSLQTKMNEISLRYFLKAREIFTPEQISRLPYDCWFGFTYGSGTGWGWRRGQGKGWGKVR
jgi:Spy/CpxP family protein refolding chaperone